MSQTELTQEQMVEAVYRYAAEQMEQNVSDAQIERNLIDQGLTAGDACSVIQNLRQARDSAKRSAAIKNIIFGGLWFVGGTVITVATMGAAASSPGGGRYVVAWGAIIFGGIQMVRGFIQLASR